MRFDRSPDSYRARALTAERIASDYSLAGNDRWAAIWRQIADDMRAYALQGYLTRAKAL